MSLADNSDRAPDSLATVEYWNSTWTAERPRYKLSQVLFQDVFKKYLTPGQSCFEIGCFPGRYLIYLAKEMKCRVSGIDFTDQFPAMESQLAEHNVVCEELVNGDFFAYPAQRQYDFVYSLGFIEHFPNFQDVIRRHTQFVRPGGLLFLECPNFRGLVQNVFHRVFDRTNLDRHHCPAMNLAAWRRVLEPLGFRTLEARYEGTCSLWTEQDASRGKLARRVSQRLVRYSEAVERRVRWPNRLTSPFMLAVFRNENRGDAAA